MNEGTWTFNSNAFNQILTLRAISASCLLKCSRGGRTYENSDGTDEQVNREIRARGIGVVDDGGNDRAVVQVVRDHVELQSYQATVPE